MKIYKMIIETIILLVFSTSVYSATLVIDNGQLAGADNIVFDGYTGSVRFVEGSCESLFGGCNDPEDLVFQSLTDSSTNAQLLAVTANQALLDQVIKANPLYDDNPTLVFGCGDSIVALSYCAISTPYFTASGIYSPSAVLVRYGDNDAVSVGGSNPIDFSSIQTSTRQPDQLVFAAWELTPVPVPVPAAAWLFGSGLLGLTGIARRKLTA